MKFFQTKAYRVIMGYVYGWGAAAVIVGALFKIMHLPGAGIVLTAGMLVEAGIFFLSVFEPTAEHYDWARVFPVLGKNHSEWEQNSQELQMPIGAMPVQNVQQGGGNVGLGLAPEDLERLKSGIDKFAATAENFASVVGSTPDMAQKMEQVSASLGELGEQAKGMNTALKNSVEGIVTGCDGINQILNESAHSLTMQMKDNCEKLSSSIGGSVDSFNTLSRLMDEQYQQLKNNAGDYTQQIAGVNKNISALNALYELQIHETKDCLESFRGMQGDMGEILENVSLSLDSAKLFKQESQQLAHNVASLNAVYGNMLSVVNNN